MLRVTLSGVESVGKSTLAQTLAAHFHGLVVPEFGRTYTEKLKRDLTLDDHHAIAHGHKISAEQTASANPSVLIEDTDIIMTTAWATMLFGKRDPILAEWDSQADCHMLLAPDVPFVNDPVRLFGKENERLRFHDIIVAEFADRNLQPHLIAGSWDDRLHQAIQLIEANL